MTPYIQCHRLNVATALLNFVDQSVLPGTHLDRETFWEGFDDLIHELAPVCRDLLEERARLQQVLADRQHTPAKTPGTAQTPRRFFKKTGYLHATPEQVRIRTLNVDLEISDLAGPQLQVPGDHAGAVLSAINARWGSLYQALYYSDAIAQQPGWEIGHQYNPQRGANVVVQTREWLDRIAPLAVGTHVDARHYRIRNGQLNIILASGDETGLLHPQQWVGYGGEAIQPDTIVLKHHGLHVIICVDPPSLAGGCDVAGICDVQLEAALSLIFDVKDTLPTVNAAHTLRLFSPWLELMKGEFKHANPDRCYQTAAGGQLKLPGRALLLLNLNELPVASPAIIDARHQPIPQIILDAVLGSLIGLHDQQRRGNSHAGSIYLVVPGLEGPDEVAFVDRLLTHIEALLSLAPHTLKLGLIDQHPRTHLNLQACLQAATHRMALLQGGPKSVLVGLDCGLRGRAQIADATLNQTQQMGDMMKRGLEPLRNGASSTLVPTPLAATLHALHYHQVNVREVQIELERHNLHQRCAVMQSEWLEQLGAGLF